MNVFLFWSFLWWIIISVIKCDSDVFLNLKVFQSKSQCEHSHKPEFIASFDEVTGCADVEINTTSSTKIFVGHVSTNSVEGPCINRVYYQECNDNGCSRCNGNVYYWNECTKTEIFGYVKFSLNDDRISDGMGKEIVRLDYYRISDGCAGVKKSSPSYSVSFSDDFDKWCPLPQGYTERIQNKCQKINDQIVYVAHCTTIKEKWYSKWWGILIILSSILISVPLTYLLFCGCIFLLVLRPKICLCVGHFLTWICCLEALNKKCEGFFLWDFFFCCFCNCATGMVTKRIEKRNKILKEQEEEETTQFLRS